MLVTLHSPSPRGTLRAPRSKSEAHRALICAAFASAPTQILCDSSNDDIDATVDCLCALGAGIARTAQGFWVTPIAQVPAQAVLDVRESGSTLRFLLPVIAALGVRARIMRRGRLPERPLSPLRELLEQNGVCLCDAADGALEISGKLCPGDLSISANISSQFISGLLFALPLLDAHRDLTVRLVGQVESRPYIDMTLRTLRAFGIFVREQDGALTVPAHSVYLCPGTLCISGDWSGAAAFACMGAIGRHAIALEGLDLSCAQGDRAILSVLAQMGAKVHVEADAVTLSPTPLRGVDIDAANIPDLVPVLAATAALANGKTRIRGASRLRFKESDRLASTCAVLCALGADVTQTEDGLVIVGKPTLAGGRVEAFGDHRIAMCAAVASLGCQSPVIIDGAQAVNKSYPAFWEQFSALCGRDSVIF